MKSMLHDADPNNQVLAADALGHMGPTAEDAVPDLVQLLRSAMKQYGHMPARRWQISVWSQFRR